MSSKTITVLTITGRRQNVKIDPDTTILEVLEYVCEKHKLNADEFDLTRHNKSIDLTCMYRFAGIPNNAVLEMVEAKTVRVDAKVLLVIQIENGDRRQDSFKPSAKLYEVVQKLFPEQANNVDSVIIYMRKEVFGEALKETSLKSLGLIGGRAILRLIQRNPESLKEQANVSAPLRVKEKFDEKITKDEVPLEDGTEIMAVDAEQSSTNFKLSYICESDAKKAKTESKVEITKMEIETVSEDISPEPIIEIIGDREAILYSLDSVERDNFDNLPDSFFEITITDVRKLYSDLKRKIKDLEEEPLMTSEYRQLEDSKRILDQIGRYKQTTIRIQFPDRYILQGIFKPTETFAEVKTFVQYFLQDINFHLYTTPPKEIVSTLDSLVEAKCVPTALIHFGCDDKNEKFLKEKYYEKLSNATGAALIAARSRGLKYANSDIQQKHSTEEDTNKEKSNHSDNKLLQSPVAASSKDVQIPKWFKPLGK